MPTVQDVLRYSVTVCSALCAPLLEARSLNVSGDAVPLRAKAYMPLLLEVSVWIHVPVELLTSTVAFATMVPLAFSTRPLRSFFSESGNTL